MEDTINEAKIQQQIETNDKLDSLNKIAEASLVQQTQTESIIKDIQPAMEAMLLKLDEIANSPKELSLKGVDVTAIKGEKGDKPTDEEITALIEPLLPSTEDFTAMIEPLIPAPIQGEKGDPLRWEDLTEEQKLALKGDKGDTYILTEEDKQKIAQSVPIVEKVIEKTIVEKPIVKEKAKYETAEEIAQKLNTLTKQIDFKVIKNFPDITKTLGAGYLRELSDVNLGRVNPTNGQALVWNSITNKWEPGSVTPTTPTLQQVTTAGNTSTTFIDVNGVVTTFTSLKDSVNNKYIDLLANSTASGNVTFPIPKNLGGGIYASTVAYQDWVQAQGYISSITASAPLYYSAGSFYISQSNATTDGYLSATDWNTFNNKQNALTNPVTGTGVAGQVTYWNGTSSTTGDDTFFWDSTNKRFIVGSNTIDTISPPSNRASINAVWDGSGGSGSATVRAIAFDDSISPSFTVYRAKGTLASLTSLLNGDSIGTMNNFGYGDGWILGGTIGFSATEDWNATSAGSRFNINLNRQGTTTLDRTWSFGQGAMTFNVDQSASLGSSTFQFNAVYTNAVNAKSGTALTLNTEGGNTMRFQINSIIRQFLASNGNISIGPAIGATDLGYALGVQGTSLTGSASNGAFGIIQTWNTTGNPTAILANITNTASGATSKLMELQVGGTGLFTVDKNGNVGLLSPTPTNTLTLGSTSTGMVLYSTADQTNYTRLRMYNTSSIFHLASEFGGSITTSQNLRISARNGLNYIEVAHTNGAVGTPAIIDINPGGTTWTPISAGSSYKPVVRATGTTGGTANFVPFYQISPQWSGTGTNGYTALMVSAYETGTGTGSKLLLDLGTNTAAGGTGVHTSLFAVDSTGNVSIGTTAASRLSIAGNKTSTVALSTTGGIISVAAQTLTDSVGTGTITHAAMNALGITTVNATNTVNYGVASTFYIDGAPTQGTNVTITNPYSLYVNSGNTFLGGNLQMTGATLTGSLNTSLVTLNQTWNTTGSPTGIFANFTNTASGSAAKIIDLQIGSVSQFNITKSGATNIGNTTNTTRKLYVQGNVSGGIAQFQRDTTGTSGSVTSIIAHANTSNTPTAIFGPSIDFVYSLNNGTNTTVGVVSGGRIFDSLNPTNNNYGIVSFGVNSNGTLRYPLGLSAGTATTAWAFPRVSIGDATLDSSWGTRGAILNILSNSLGMYIPRLTTTQKNAITGMQQGLLLVDTTLDRVGYYSSASAWHTLVSADQNGKINLPSGSIATGTGTLVNGTVTISNTCVTASSIILLTNININGSSAIGTLTQGTITAGTSFVVNSVKQNNPSTIETADQSTFRYLIIN